MLKDEPSRFAYDSKLEHARQLLDVPIWDTLESKDLDTCEEEEGSLLSHTCRCGGSYRINAGDIIGQNRVVLPCDTCSLYIEILHSRPA